MRTRALSATIGGMVAQVYDLNHLSDEDLLKKSLAAPSAFEILITRYQRHFLERATHVVKTRDEAEDVVQETFVRIYRFATKYEEKHGTFKAWAMTILMNVARTRYQKQVTMRGRIAPLSTDHYEQLAAPSTKDAAHAKDAIERALAQIPEDSARLIRLAYLEELPYVQIAEREGITVGALKTRIHRLKKELRYIIGEL